MNEWEWWEWFWIGFAAGSVATWVVIGLWMLKRFRDLDREIRGHYDPPPQHDSIYGGE